LEEIRQASRSGLAEANSTWIAACVVIRIADVVLEGAGQAVEGESFAKFYDRNEEGTPGEFVRDSAEKGVLVCCWFVIEEISLCPMCFLRSCSDGIIIMF